MLHFSEHWMAHSQLCSEQGFLPVECLKVKMKLDQLLSMIPYSSWKLCILLLLSLYSLVLELVLPSVKFKKTHHFESKNLQAASFLESCFGEKEGGVIFY